MVATVLKAGEFAIIGYNGGASDGTGRPATTDKIHFVLLAPIGVNTVIYFTDRTWTPTAGNSTLNAGTFGNSGTDGTFAYTAGADLPAGTVITITQAQLSAAGVDFEHASGEAIYAYQGTGPNAPTTFLFALEAGDGNATFAASLVNTGLFAGTTAVSVAYDSGSYSGPTTHAGAFLFNGTPLINSIADATNWGGDDVDGQNAIEAQIQTGPWLTAPRLEILGAAGGGGGGIVRTGRDETVAAGATDYNHAELYNGLLSNGNQFFWAPRDMAFDTVEGKFFVVDSDITGGHNRILQGNIADLNGNTGSAPTLTVLYSDVGTTTASRLDNFDVDIVNNIIYFTHGSELLKVGYDAANQAATVLFRANVNGTTSPSAVGNPAGSGDNFFNDMVVNFATNRVYLSSTRVGASSGGDLVVKNFIYELSGLTTTSGTDAFQFNSTNTGTARLLPFAQNDDAFNPNAGTSPNQVSTASDPYFLAREYGSLDGLAIDPVSNALYFSTGAILFDHDGNGMAPLYQTGIIGRYALGANAANGQGFFTITHTQPGGQGSGLYGDLEIDLSEGKWYVTDYSGTNASNVDSHIYRGDLAATNGARTQFSEDIGNIEGLTLVGLTINRAPTVAGTGIASTIVEASAAAGSGNTTAVLLFSGITLDDIDTTTANELSGAVVRIATNFQSGATHQDFLRINGNTSGTTASGIAYTYTAATGALVLTGQNTVAAYKAAIELVTFGTSGDNPTNFGYAPNRTIAVAVSDGLSVSDEITALVSIIGINDAPVNVVGAAVTGTEDVLVTAVTGLQVTDIDADPAAAAQKVVVTLSVNFGTLTILTNVAGGIVAGDITGGANNSASITITATQTAINATLATVNATPAQNGLTLTTAVNFNGASTLTITTNDQGANGNDPGNTGTATSESDVDTKVITITAVNDAPLVNDFANVVAAPIFEDQPSTAGQTVSALFGGRLIDTFDQQQSAGNATGSVANTIGGIAITANGSNANGAWQYFNGVSWVDIGAASETAAKLISAATAIRFNPATNYNGPAAPTLTVALIDTSFGAITNGATANVATRGGTTAFSIATLTLTEAVNAVNDAPQFAAGGAQPSYTENAAPVAIAAGVTLSDVDNANFNGGTLTVAITAGLVAGDGLSLPTSGTVIVDPNTGVVTVNGVTVGSVTALAVGSATVTFNTNATPTAVIAVTQAVGYVSTSEDPTNAARTVTFTLVDGAGAANNGADTASFTRTVSVVPVDDLPVAVADPFTTAENAVATGSLTSNDTDVDAGPKTVATVNGAAGNVGAQVTLASGARLTVQSDGSYSYDPNGAFNYLVAAGGSSGAQSSATDSFTYALNGGSSTTVTITIAGVDGAGDQLRGSAGGDAISGTGGADYVDISQGGGDTVNAGDGDDLIFAGSAFDATDQIVGGLGYDQVGLRSSFTGSLGNVVDTEFLAVLSGTSTRFGGDGTARYTYNLTTTDATVAGTDVYTVQANELVAGENLRFDGAAETAGAFRVFAGKGVDTLIGGAGNDGFFFGEGGRFTEIDQVNGGGGNDQLGLRGNYSVSFGINTVVNVETIVLMSAVDTAAAAREAQAYNYTLVLNNGAVAPNATLTVNAAQLRSTESANVNGVGETNGKIVFIGGQGADTFVGGAGADTLFGGLGADTLTGGAGNDVFLYRAVAESGPAAGVRDSITDFRTGDLIDLSVIDAITGGADNAFTFIGSAAFTNGTAGQLRATATGGGVYTVEGDVDGNGIADFAITVTSDHAIVITDFIL